MANETDYKELLRKYIKHVANEEGIDFISHGRIEYAEGMTVKERFELERLSREVSDAR